MGEQRGLVIKGNSQGTLAISAVAAQTAALHRGVYDVWSDADCWIKVDTTANDVTTSTGYKLFAGNVVPLEIGEGDKIGAIAGAASNLHYHKVAP